MTVTTERTSTAQQDAIYDQVRNGSGHVLVEALAGTGKTTTSVQAARLAGGKVGFAAFNKTIATELKQRLAGSARASTLHGLGYAAVKRAFPSAELAEGKAKQKLQAIEPEWFWTTRRGGVACNGSARAVLDLASWCKKTLVDATDPVAMDAMADYYGVELGDFSFRGHADAGHPLYQKTAQLLEACESATTVDYDDMVWLPVRLGLRVDQYDMLFVDEVQDLGAGQRALAKAACRHGRMVCVGDRNQSINGFAGADPESVPALLREMSATPSGCTRLPLTTTWRCPRSHVEMANELVPDLEAAPGAIDGLVETIDESDAVAHIRREMQPGDMVLSRRSAPLVSLVFRLLGAGMPAVIRGRDVGNGLLDLLDNFVGITTPNELARRLVEYEEAELIRLERKDAPEASFQSLQDRVGCLKELNSRAHTLGQLRDTILSLFSDGGDAGKIVLSTVHRAKGLEAERVLIVDTKCMPLVLSCKTCRGRGYAGSSRGATCERCRGRGTRQKAWEVQQEQNLLYVAVTRSKHTLTFAGPVPALLGGDWS